MNAMLFSLAVVAATASAAAPQTGQAAAELNAVRGVAVETLPDGASVVIKGSRPAIFTVFKLTDPARLVIDLASADISAAAAPADGSGPVLGVTARQFSNDKQSVGRVTIALADGAGYDVKGRGNDVLVKVTQPGTTLAPGADSKPVAGQEQAAAPADPPATAAKVAPPAPKQAPAKPGESAVAADADGDQPTHAETKVAANETAPQGPSDVVKSTVDEKSVERPAHALSAVRFANNGAESRAVFITDAELSKFEVLELANPPRIAVDLYGVDAAPKRLAIPRGKTSLIRDARVGKHQGMVRVVMELEQAPGHYTAHRTDKGLWIGIAPNAVAEAPAVKTTPTSEPQATRAPSAAKKTNPAVKDVGFEGGAEGGVVAIQVSRSVPYEVTRPDKRTRVLTLHGASLPKKLERSLDTTAFGGPVKMVSAFTPAGEADSVQIVATLDGEPTDEVAVTPTGLHWMFVVAGKPIVAEAVIDGKPAIIESSTTETKVSGFSAEAPNYAASGAPQLAKYTGRRVSFEFKDIDIHNLLRIIAEVSKKNLVVADNVQGRITIRLKNVPWDQALDLILKSKGLDKEVTGNIVRIAPLKDLEEERKLRLEAMKAREKSEPLKVRIMPVNYARAGDITDKVKSVLSERGEVSIDQRTNVIIAKDTVEALARAEGLIRNLDTPTPQVLIESRIVEANVTFSREVGIQWGGNVSAMPSLGNSTGLVFPNSINVAGGASQDVINGLAATIPNWAVSLPAAVGDGSGGAMGFSFGSAGGAIQLNLRLSALEATGEIKTISAPKVTTLDNNDATISQGVSIPFSQVSASGVNTQFIEARLQLTVTPHVTSDGSVLMKIQATNNQPDPALTGANGQPAISKKEARTEVMVKDGDTTVIGGIYTRASSSNEQYVPLLGKIPLLGWLFKHRAENDTRTELLIFITPHIVNRNQVQAQAEAGT